jgi:excinuclease ABC subunit C
MDNLKRHLEMIDITGVPDSPGCYIYSNADNKIIYIGKAKNLKKRVKSYFQKRDLDPKTELLVQNIRAVDFIVTNNEVEALLLENTLIKKHHPKYNIDLKDAKSYAYIRKTDEAFPRLVIARTRHLKLKGEFFGPFVSANARDHVLAVLKKTFQLRTCKRLPKKSCLRYHINLCPAPCINKVSDEEYGEKIKRVRMVLKGKAQELINRMTEEMKRASGEMYFERAMELRDQINALKGLLQRQNMERQKKYNEDIVSYLIKNDTLYLLLFNVYKGTLENKQSFQLPYHSQMENVFEHFLTQFYDEGTVPRELIVPEPISEPVAEFLRMKSNQALKITVPQRGEKKHLLKLVEKNIQMTFFGDIEKLKDLKSKLKMQEMPIVIECFDISHISGTSTVASMVQFRNALPDKSNYRRYRIKTVEGIDDFGSIAEVVRRRYTRLKEEQAEMPDLILIDGGLGQLNAATTEIKKLNVKIPTISIAKRLEEIFIPGADEPLLLSRKTKALQLLQSIRDEAHRFAITYNRLLRKKELLDQLKKPKGRSN